MTRTKRTVLAVLLAVCIALAGLLVVLAMATGGGKTAGTAYLEHLTAAQRHSQAGDYTAAVLAYQDAIRADDEQPAPYIGLAGVYLGQQRMSLAHSILLQGLEKTGSAEIQNMLDIHFGAEEPQLQALKQESALAVNTTLLAALAGKDHAGLVTAYGAAGYEAADGGIQVRYANLGASLLYRNTAEDGYVINESLGRPYDTKRPAEIRFDSLALLVSGLEGAASMDALRAAGAAGVECLFSDAYGLQVVRFTAGGCEVLVASDSAGNISPGAWHVVLPLEAEEEPEGDQTLKGRVTDAVDAAGLDGVTMEFRPGSGRTGAAAYSVTTDRNGGYELRLEPGDYTVELKKDGYVTEYAAVFVSGITSLTEAAFVLSPTLNEGEIRIVLTWGASPRDLDSYLFGDIESDGFVYVYYGQRQYRRDGKLMAELDVDVTRGYGPETVTIYEINNSYRFTVTDFHNTGTMAASGAQVKVYLPGDTQPTVINVPSGVENVWNVCEIDHGVLRIL